MKLVWYVFMTYNLIRNGKIMCQYCEEDRPTIACDLTIVDSECHMTYLQKQRATCNDIGVGS